MDKPRSVPGTCPFYDHPSSKCYLTESYQDGSTRDYHCKSEQNCKTCGNYEAWRDKRNYLNK